MKYLQAKLIFKRSLRSKLSIDTVPSHVKKLGHETLITEPHPQPGNGGEDLNYLQGCKHPHNNKMAAIWMRRGFRSLIVPFFYTQFSGEWARDHARLSEGLWGLAGRDFMSHILAFESRMIQIECDLSQQAREDYILVRRNKNFTHLYLHVCAGRRANLRKLRHSQFLFLLSAHSCKLRKHKLLALFAFTSILCIDVKLF